MMKIQIEDLDATDKQHNCNNCYNIDVCSLAFMHIRDINEYFGTSNCKKWKFRTPTIHYKTQDINIIRKFYDLVKEVNK